jgi:hypothetical protein
LEGNIGLDIDDVRVDDWVGLNVINGTNGISYPREVWDVEWLY